MGLCLRQAMLGGDQHPVLCHPTTGKDRIASSYSAETSASAKSRYMAELFSSAWPLSNCSLGLMRPFLVRNVMIWCRKRCGYTRF